MHLNLNLIIAIIFSVLSLTGGYIVWYIIRGHKKKKNSPNEEKGEQPAPETESVAEGYNRDSYCYPHINDMMGFEFISVVRVPQDLLEPKKKSEKSAAEKLEQSQGIGLTTVSGEQTESEDEDNEPVPPTRQYGPRNKTKDKEEDSYEIMDEVIDITADEMERLSKMGDWTSRDYDSCPTEDEIDNMLRNNADMVEEEGPDEEALRIAKEQEALNQIQMMENAIERGEDARLEARQIQELLDNDSQGTTDIDEEDIPEI